MSEITEQDIRQAIRDILPETVQDGVMYLQKALADKQIVNTQELLNSVDHVIREETSGMVGSIFFTDYGRYKDMKNLRWNGKMPPVEELIEWIKGIGLGKFAWIPGYESTGKVPSESEAIRRLAWSFAKAMGSVPVTKRKYAGTWYNENVMKLVNVTRVRILRRVTEIVAKNVAGEAADVIEIDQSFEE